MSMTTILGIAAQLVILLTSIKLITEILKFWFGREGDLKLRSTFEDIWMRFEETLPETIVLKPLGVLSNFYDRLLGERPFSARAFKITFAMTSLMLAITLSITGMLTGKPFGFGSPPWETYRLEQSFLQQLATNEDYNNPAGERFYVRENATFLTQFDGVPYEIAYTVFFVLMVLLDVSVLVFLTSAMSRLILREMLAVRSVFSLIFVFISNLTVVAGFTVINSILLFLALNVGAWPVIPVLFALSQLHILASFGVVIGTTGLAWFFGGPWFKVVVLFSLFPALVTALTLAGCALGFPFRRFFRSLTIKFFERGLEHKEGIFSYIGMMAFLLGSFIAVIVRFSGG